MERSWLLVPADSEKKLGLALGTGADVLVLDLANVALEAKDLARTQAADWLKLHRQQVVQRKVAFWVRINPLDSRAWRDDLLAVLPAGPEGIMLPKATGPEAVQQLGAELYELEQSCGVTNGSTRIMPVLGGTARGALQFAAIAEMSSPRLSGLAWNPEELAAAIGATRTRDGQTWTAAFAFVRAQTLLTAHARAIPAIDTQHPDFSDLKAFKAIARASRADGFTGMLAIHPAQVPIINEAFAPSEAELEEARAVIGAFEGGTSGGALRIDRRMVDRTVLEQARRVLGMPV